MHRRPALFQTLEARQLLAVHLAGDVDSGTVAGKDLPIAGSVTLFNEGSTATSAAVPYKLVLVSKNVYHPEDTIDVLGSFTTPAIVAGGQQTVDFSFPIQSAWYGKMYFIHLTIDPDNVIVQDNESENDNYGAEIRIAAPFVGNHITGTSGNDLIGLSEKRGFLFVSDTRFGGGGNEQDGYTSGYQSVSLDDISDMTVDLLGGDDSFYVEPAIALPVTLFGGAGNDRIDLGAGDDSVDAGDGNDTVWGLGGNDTLVGGSGRDELRGNDGDDYLKGNAGGDYLTGGDGDDYVVGNGGNDRLLGGEGFDRLVGSAGNDRFVGGREVDTISGQEGFDTSEGGAGDILYSIELTTV